MTAQFQVLQQFWQYPKPKSEYIKNQELKVHDLLQLDLLYSDSGFIYCQMTIFSYRLIFLRNLKAMRQVVIKVMLSIKSRD